MNRLVTLFILLLVAASESFGQSAEGADLHFDCDKGKPPIHLLYVDSEAHAGLKDAAATNANYGLYRIVNANKPGMHTDKLDLTVSVPSNAPDSDQLDIVLSGPCELTPPILRAGGYILEIKASALRYKGPPPQTGTLSAPMRASIYDKYSRSKTAPCPSPAKSSAHARSRARPFPGTSNM